MNWRSRVNHISVTMQIKSNRKRIETALQQQERKK